MKKLVAAGCFVLAFQSLSQVGLGNDPLDQLNGKRMLVRAISVIVNTESARKVPPKRIAIPNLESPRA